ncbi:MAG: enoyl-CoA hydratase [Deltaproteobacteria bacterium]|nr:enoyl-CoA hydratase [Deltaproteobacteria bacterium]|tara:strand:+ start:641 stop:1453 length:813 start_codon:yes stop_codon:yes gene_type:complete
MSETLLIKNDSNVAEIEINRPDHANAIDEELWFAIGNCFSELNESKSVRVCIISGTGSNFTSGIDLKYLQHLAQESEIYDCDGRKREFLRNKILKLQSAFSQIENCRKPIISAIHGGCIGAGVDLISACDMRYSTKKAVFQIKEIDLGITADVGTLQRLPHLIPHGIVRELAYTGRKFSGKEAQSFGLINNCYEDKKTMMTEVRKIAEQIARKSPLAIRGVKETLLYSRDHSVASGLNHVATWNSAMLLSSDLEESIMAMIQNRTPEYND